MIGYMYNDICHPGYHDINDNLIKMIYSYINDKVKTLIMTSSFFFQLSVFYHFVIFKRYSDIWICSTVELLEHLIVS